MYLLELMHDGWINLCERPLATIYADQRSVILSADLVGVVLDFPNRLRD